MISSHPLEIHSFLLNFPSSPHLNALLFILFTAHPSSIRLFLDSKKTTRSNVSECVRKTTTHKHSLLPVGAEGLPLSHDWRRSNDQIILHTSDKDFFGIDNTSTQTEHLPCAPRAPRYQSCVVPWLGLYQHISSTSHASSHTLMTSTINTHLPPSSLCQ